MRLDILAAESLGVRGLCCLVEAGDRAIVIDPGVALGDWRYGLPPHPVQVAAGRAVRRRIVTRAQKDRRERSPRHARQASRLSWVARQTCRGLKTKTSATSAPTA